MDATSVLAKLINSCTDHPWHIPYSLLAHEEPQATLCSRSQSLPSLWHIWIPTPGPVGIAHTPAEGEKAVLVQQLQEELHTWSCAKA